MLGGDASTAFVNEATAYFAGGDSWPVCPEAWAPGLNAALLSFATMYRRQSAALDPHLPYVMALVSLVSTFAVPIQDHYIWSEDSVKPYDAALQTAWTAVTAECGTYFREAA